MADPGFRSAPKLLGRGVIVNPDQPAPPGFESFERIAVTEATVADPGPTVERLHRAWAGREPVVVELHVDAATLKRNAEAQEKREPWLVGDRFLFDAQRLHFLVWNNNWDHRGAEPIWWWGRKALALGAQPSDLADIVLPSGQHAYCDGGPVSPLDIEGDIAVVPYIAVESGELRVLTDDPDVELELADDQRRAVLHRGGAARIIAPAGSGKTRVLTERLRYVLKNWSLQPSSVCTVAYNTRAAQEMNDRTQGLPANIRTLNALALAIVNGSGGFARSSLEARPRTMLTERDVRSLLQGLVELPRRMNNDPYAVWIEALSAVRLGLQPPHDVEAESADLDGFTDVFDRYRTLLDERGLLDFDEQIYRAIEILLQDPVARTTAQRRCRMMLVDEFQDLTPAHLLMVRLLASPALDVFGVGDDDQVIYGYAGANPDYLVSFAALFPGAAEHALEVNYRCPPAVITAASNLLTRNAPRVPKSIHARPDREPESEDLRIEQLDEADLAIRAADLIQTWLADGVQPHEIAVLSRVNVTLLPVQVCLEDRGISHTTPVDGTLLQRTGIATALAYLRIGAAPSLIRRADIQSTVHRPGRKIARNVVDMMTKRASSSVSDLRKLANHLSGNDSSRVTDYAADLQAIADAMRAGTTERALDVIRSSIGLGETMSVLDASRREADRSTHNDDLAALAAVAHLHDAPDSFEPWLRDMLNRPGDETGVHLSTVHRVKGREWKRVVVFDAGGRLFPHVLATDTDEERRVFHVAITRCFERVAVLAGKSDPSPFLGELDAPGEPAPKRAPRAKAEPKGTVDTTNVVPVEIGMTIAIPGGAEGVIVEAGDRSAVLSAGKARVSIAYGTTARLHNRLVQLAPPRDEQTQQRITALKDWRRRTAAESRVPAYTVLHDAHIEAIAISRPTSLAELATCKGVGTTKLERWGDEILAALDHAESTSAA